MTSRTRRTGVAILLALSLPLGASGCGAGKAPQTAAAPPQLTAAQASDYLDTLSEEDLAAVLPTYRSFEDGCDPEDYFKSETDCGFTAQEEEATAAFIALYGLKHLKNHRPNRSKLVEYRKSGQKPPKVLPGQPAQVQTQPRVQATRPGTARNPVPAQTTAPRSQNTSRPNSTATRQQSNTDKKSTNKK